MQSLYKCYMRNGIPSNMCDAVQMQSGARFLARGLESKERPITDEARVSFMAAWGHTPDEQVALESYYDGLVIDYKPDHIENLDQVLSSPF